MIVGHSREIRGYSTELHDKSSGMIVGDSEEKPGHCMEVSRFALLNIAYICSVTQECFVRAVANVSEKKAKMKELLLTSPIISIL